MSNCYHQLRNGQINKILGSPVRLFPFKIIQVIKFATSMFLDFAEASRECLQHSPPAISVQRSADFRSEVRSNEFS